MYLLRDHEKLNPNFVAENIEDLCASLQTTVVEVLISKLKKAAIDLDIKTIAVAGGVSANSELRTSLQQLAQKHRWKMFVPSLAYTTDNAAMIAITGYFKYLNNDFCPIGAVPYSRVSLSV